MAKIFKNKNDQKSGGKEVKQSELSYTTGGSGVWQFPMKPNIYSSNDSTDPLLGIYPREQENFGNPQIPVWDVSDSFIYTHLEQKTTQMSFSWGVGKQSVVYPDNGILLSSEKEQAIDTCHSLHECIMLVNQTV